MASGWRGWLNTILSRGGLEFQNTFFALFSRVRPGLTPARSFGGTPLRRTPWLRIHAGIRPFGLWLLLTHAKMPETNVDLGGFWTYGLGGEGSVRLGDDDGA